MMRIAQELTCIKAPRQASLEASLLREGSQETHSSHLQDSRRAARRLPASTLPRDDRRMCLALDGFWNLIWVHVEIYTANLVLANIACAADGGN